MESELMKVTHELEITAKCPVKPVLDTYQCKIVTARLIRVEDILDAANAYSDKEIYQEDLCLELANTLRCEVTLKGKHSGVTTEVTCGNIFPW